MLVRRGRFIAAEPYFEGGSIISLGNGRAHADAVGQLVLVSGTGDVGRVIEVLGAEGDIGAVLRGLLAERGAFGVSAGGAWAPGDLDADVEQELLHCPAEVPLMEQRMDLRGQPCVTIDPPDAKDHDDAVHVEAGEAGGWTVWVHIADVAAYVPAGSALDRHALDRALSTYVPGQVAPMLPSRLSGDLCSLRPGVDRGCVSTRFELDEAGAVQQVSFHRTVIRSARRLSYGDVDEVLAGRRALDVVVDGMLRELDVVTRVLRHVRIARGALDLALPETVIDVVGGAVTGAVLKAPSPSHRLIEECMLLVNEAVGERLARAQAPGVWRVHDHPDPAAIEGLVGGLELLGVPTPAVPEQLSGAAAARAASAIAASVGRYVEASRRGRVAFLPRVLRALQQARYAAHVGVHSGLASPCYAHFTSPIRRYPDIVNHRSLLALMGLGDGVASAVDLDVVADHVTEVERLSVQTERRGDSIALSHLLHHALLGGGGGPSVVGGDEDGSFSGEITGVIGSGMFVRFGGVFEGMVFARTLAADERYEIDEHGLALVGRTSGHQLRIGDAVSVYVSRVDRATGRVDLRVVGSTGEASERSGAGAGGRHGARRGKPVDAGGGRDRQRRGSGKGRGRGRGPRPR